MNCDYKKMYLHLFNAVTDAIECLPLRPEAVKDLLVQTQQECEEMYIEADEK